MCGYINVPTHYIEEAEEIADRVGVINQGELLLVEDKDTLMHKLGKRQLVIELVTSLTEIPEVLKSKSIEFGSSSEQLIYTYDPHTQDTGINELLKAIQESGLVIKDVHSIKTSLEEIFVKLVNTQP